MLVNYNGDTITYDEIGNPLNYRNGIQLTWENGRNLKTFRYATGSRFSYTYDANGMRTSKSSNGVTTYCHLDGDKII